MKRETATKSLFKRTEPSHTINGVVHTDIFMCSLHLCVMFGKCFFLAADSQHAQPNKKGNCSEVVFHNK